MDLKGKISKNRALSFKIWKKTALNKNCTKKYVKGFFKVLRASPGEKRILTSMILIISLSSMVPLPSMSYIRKAHSNFRSGVPLEVTLIANRNSLKSIKPELSVSKVRKTKKFENIILIVIDRKIKMVTVIILLIKVQGALIRFLPTARCTIIIIDNYTAWRKVQWA